jgi:serine/threonine protein kinase
VQGHAAREQDDGAAYLVAVKLLHEERAEDKRELLEEAAVLAQFQHPQVVQLVGVVTAGSPSMMVVEYMEHGSLGQWLKGEGDNPVGMGWRLVWACDVAAGLAYVHGLGFCHRDIAARNVLLSSEMRAKLSDFGMARDVQEGSSVLSQPEQQDSGQVDGARGAGDAEIHGGQRRVVIRGAAAGDLDPGRVTL